MQTQEAAFGEDRSMRSRVARVSGCSQQGNASFASVTVVPTTCQLIALEVQFLLNTQETRACDMFYVIILDTSESCDVHGRLEEEKSK